MVRTGDGRGKQASQLFIRNRRKKKKNTQLDFLWTNFFLVSSCSMFDSLPKWGYGFTHHRVLYCLIATNSQVHSKKKNIGLQWATLYLSKKNTLLYHCFVPLTYKGLASYIVPKKATIHRAPVLPFVLTVPAFSHRNYRESNTHQMWSHKTGTCLWDTNHWNGHTAHVSSSVLSPHRVWRTAMWNVQAGEPV